MNEMQVIEPTALQEITRGEIDIQIATAKQYPRSLEKFQKSAQTMATLNPDIASRCFYVLQRKDKKTGKIKRIEGPSVRLAEIATSAWTNLRCGARVIEIGKEFVVSQGFCHDLETNTAIAMEVRRRITTSDGRRYSDDMIMVTSNAANSIAMRNSVLRVIPNAFIQQLFDKVKKVAVGDAKTIEQSRKNALEKFKELGVKEKQILEYLDRPSVQDIDLKDLETLLGVYTAIQDGDTSVAEQFPTGKPEVKPSKIKEHKGNGKQEPKKESKVEMDKNIFDGRIKEILESLYAQGWSEKEVHNNIGANLVKKGFLADFTKAEPKERIGVLEIMESFVEKKDA